MPDSGKAPCVQQFESLDPDFRMLQVLFRSVNKLLMDTSTSEYLFCIDFFQEDLVYHELIASTLSVIEAALTAQLQVNPTTFILICLDKHMLCWGFPGLPLCSFCQRAAALTLRQSSSPLLFIKATQMFSEL